MDIIGFLLVGFFILTCLALMCLAIMELPICNRTSLAVLYHPFQYCEFDSAFNDEMKEFLKSDCKIVVDNSTAFGVFTAKFGFADVWVRNWPYACFTKDTGSWGNSITIRPSRLTMYKMAKRFKKDTGINIYELNKVTHK